MKKTDSILNSDYEGCVCIIEENITSESFEALMAHRGLEKIYRNTQITEGQKDLLIEKIASKIPDQKGKIINSYLFLKLFMPIGEEILAKMADRITRNFPDSLSVFYFCFGEFVTENPEIIGTAKNIMLSVAKKCLKDDTSAIYYNLSLSLDNIYARCKTMLHLLYEDSITYGVLLEKYDAISFGSEYDFCESKEDIKKIVPVVITSSSYFIGECEKANIPVISWDMFSQIIYSLNYYNTLSDIDEYFSNIISLYDFNMAKEITNSEIENEKFLIKYEEFEG